MLNTFTDVCWQSGADMVFCYRSGLMVYEETFGAGVLSPAGWNAAGYPLNVLTNCSSRFSRARKRDQTYPPEGAHRS